MMALRAAVMSACSPIRVLTSKRIIFLDVKFTTSDDATAEFGMMIMILSRSRIWVARNEILTTRPSLSPKRIQSPT